jgi:hypothetical protein
MNIAYLHYHLKPGGVTTVIKQQVAAIRNSCDAVIISGQPSDDPDIAETKVIKDIAYDNQFKTNLNPEEISTKIINAISDKWDSGCDILHVHNPLLAKNRLFLKVLSFLQKKGIRLFLQVHDFAEDGRPWSYYTDDAYPADCHYSVVNSRDYDILLQAGLNRSGLHLLSNSVNTFDIVPEKHIENDFILYPVRAIRRKNIGEAILLSLFFQTHETLAITLPPNSPRDFESYENWKSFVRANNLNVIFDASSKYNYIDLVKSAKYIITTSITEGFGFSFLEAWTAGQLLVGRNLPDICRDFTDKGVKLNHLYDRIIIPLKYIDINDFYQKWENCIIINAKKFNLKIKNTFIESVFQKLTAQNAIDFALLNEHFQEQVILKIKNDDYARNHVLRLNPFLNNMADITDRDETITNNKIKVSALFNENRYRANLLDIYQKVIQKPVSQKINKQKLADLFLNPETFSLLKWEDSNV